MAASTQREIEIGGIGRGSWRGFPYWLLVIIGFLLFMLFLLLTQPNYREAFTFIRGSLGGLDDLLGGDEFFLGFALGFAGDLDGEDFLICGGAAGFGFEHGGLGVGEFAFLVGDGDLAGAFGDFERLVFQNFGLALFAFFGDEGGEFFEFGLFDGEAALDFGEFDGAGFLDGAFGDGFILLDFVFGDFAFAAGLAKGKQQIAGASAQQKQQMCEQLRAMPRQ